MNTLPACIGHATLALTLVTCLPTHATPPKAAADPVLPWLRAVAAIQNGEPAAAREVLSKIQCASGTERRWREQLETAIKERESLAQDLLRRAVVAASRHSLSEAIRKMDLAQQLDRRTEERAEFQELRDAQVKRDAMLDKAQKCVAERAPSCLNEALADVRAIDRHSARAQQIELVAEDLNLNATGAVTSEVPSHRAHR